MNFCHFSNFCKFPGLHHLFSRSTQLVNRSFIFLPVKQIWRKNATWDCLWRRNLIIDFLIRNPRLCLQLYHKEKPGLKAIAHWRTYIQWLWWRPPLASLFFYSIWWWLVTPRDILGCQKIQLLPFVRIEFPKEVLLLWVSMGILVMEFLVPKNSLK